MISIRSSLLTIVLLHAISAKLMEPIKAEYDDEDTEYEEDRSGLGVMMQMAYNQSVPFEALRACDKQRAATCPTPSADGTHACVALNDICDHRPQCPGGEDETPVICFFHEAHARELAKLRRHAIALYREAAHHSPRAHGQH